MIHLLTILIFLTFIWDFFIAPIPSEASTHSLSQGRSLSEKAGLYLVFLVSLLLYVFPLFLSIYALSTEPFSWGIPPLHLMAITGAIMGRVITIFASVTLRRYREHHPEKTLMLDSIFRWSRNPISFGTHITLLGIVIIYNQWYLWAGFLFYVVNLHFKILLEEKALEDHFKESYKIYKERTPRYLII